MEYKLKKKNVIYVCFKKKKKNINFIKNCSYQKDCSSTVLVLQ